MDQHNLIGRSTDTMLGVENHLHRARINAALELIKNLKKCYDDESHLDPSDVRKDLDGIAELLKSGL